MEKIDNILLNIGQKTINVLGNSLTTILIGFSLSISFCLMTLGSPLVFDIFGSFVFGIFYFIFSVKMAYLAFNRRCENCNELFALKVISKSKKSCLYKCDLCTKATLRKKK